VQKLAAWARAGRMVVLPKTRLYTESAKDELEKTLSQTKKMEVDLGLSYRLHVLGDGKLILYEVPEDFLIKGEPLSSWQGFLSAVLSIAEVDTFCRLSDSRLTVIPFERKNNGLAVFVLNGTRRTVTADLMFPTQVQVADLGVTLSENESSQTPPAPSARANRFSMEVPQFGVLPLTVEGIDLIEAREKQLAALASQETQENAFQAAASELPGFDSNDTIEELWS
jgi:hypothetical protein